MMGDGAMKEDYMIDGLVMESAILELLKAWKVWKELVPDLRNCFPLPT
jgi:hypothetical protein